MQCLACLVVSGPADCDESLPTNDLQGPSVPTGRMAVGFNSPCQRLFLCCCSSGEINVIEGVNMGVGNQVTLHTGAGCTMTPQSPTPLGTLLGANCDSSSNNAGCAYKDNDPASYGAAFNDAGGGVYAHLWDSTGISVWHFSRANIPEDITAGTPNPSGWGAPVASFSSATCSMDHFKQHQLVFDITLCGDWADPTFSATCSGTRSAAVADPTNFKSKASLAELDGVIDCSLDAKWAINSVAVFGQCIT
jgi:hypothetical protein